MKTDVFVELHVPDFEKAKTFYASLGFSVVWEKEGYLVMRKNESVLNFYKGENPYFDKFPEDTKKGYAVEIILLEDNVETFHDKVKGKVKIVEPLQEREWGVKDFRIEDPFGFYIRVSQRYDWINKKE